MTVSEHPTTTFPDSVDTRLGTLRYQLGFPTPETTQKLFDEMDFQRAALAAVRERRHARGPPCEVPS